MQHFTEKHEVTMQVILCLWLIHHVHALPQFHFAATNRCLCHNSGLDGLSMNQQNSMSHHCQLGLTKIPKQNLHIVMSLKQSVKKCTHFVALK